MMRYALGFMMLVMMPALAQADSDPGAAQLVGLFGDTCLHYAGDAAGLRAFLQQEGAPVMAEPARGAFLAGRPGEVFDTSTQDVKLATISLDGGGCEAVAERAEPGQVAMLFQQAAEAAQLTLLRTPAPAKLRLRPGVQQTVFATTIGTRQMHITLSTEALAPQAVLALAPQ